MIFTITLSAAALLISGFFYLLILRPRFSPLAGLSGPDAPKGLFGLGGHLPIVLNVIKSKRAHEDYVKKYGKTFKIKGVGNWEDRLLSTDPVAIAHVMNHTLDYEKPWQARRVITRLIGEGMLSSEGQVHKRMRRVGNPAFSVQNMRALVPVVFTKAHELKDKWNEVISEKTTCETQCTENLTGTAKLDVCKWLSRATFDVIGLAGFDYNFSAIQNEDNELFMAYKDMFEIALAQGGYFRDILVVYFPWIDYVFPDKTTRIVRSAQEVIYRVGRKLVQEKKQRILEGEKGGLGKDLLSLLLKSNMSTDIAPQQRISDDDILHNINTFFFAGSDTTSLALTWTLLLLADNPSVQTRLRAELLTLTPPTPSPSASNSETMHEFYAELDALLFLQNVIRESLRLVPPIHSTIRVATRAGEIPTGEPVRVRGGSVRHGVRVERGTIVHVPVEAMNVDRTVWGEDAWQFIPDRWDSLPEAVLEQPGLYAHLLTFSAGPRSCIGQRFSMIEMKTFLYVLLTNFVFIRGEEVIFPANVVLTRPYVAGKYREGSQCPLLVKPYVPQSD